MAEACPGKAGVVAPVVDRNRCEGKAACVAVCPYDVFQMGTLTAEERAGLSFVGKLKAWGHRGKQVYVVKPQECHACRLCIDACPEKALTLAPLS